jgi:RHS repeat-associated protein
VAGREACPRVARNALVKDGLDRTLADAQTIRDLPERVVTGTYDLVGNRVAVGYPDGRKIGYVPAPDRRVLAVAEGFSTNQNGDLLFGPLLAEYAYDGPDSVGTRTYRKGTATGNDVVNVTTYAWAGDRTLAGIRSRKGPAPADELVMGIDQRIGKGGGKTYEVRLHAPERSQSYVENTIYELTGFAEGLPDPEQPSVIPAPTRSVSYSLDRMGNIGAVASAGGGLSQPGETRTHNALHQLTDVASPSDLPSAHFEYDADGNLWRETRPGWPNTVWTYEYDERNRLCRILIVSGDDFNGDRVEITQEYDARGRRTRWTVEEVWTEEGNAYVLAQDEVIFLHDGQRVIEERDGAGAVLRQYVWGPQFVDELLVQDTFTGGTFAPALRRYALQDATWSVTTLLRPDGSVEQQRFFDPYGKYTYELFPAPGQPNFYWGVYCPYRWQGKHQDDWTGLLHSRARTYRPDIQRWMQRDPAGQVDGDNLYIFVKGSVHWKLDPFGLAEYKEGEPTRPDIKWDNGFPYDPNVGADYSDYANWYLKWTVMLRGAQAWGHLPDGSRAYEHYRSASGEDLMVNYDKAYGEDPRIKAGVDAEIESAKVEAERLHKKLGKNKFNITGESVLVDSSTENWLKALGGHRIWGSAEVRYHSGTDEYWMDLTITMEDFYNFNKGQADVHTGLPDDANGRFEVLGWAKSFYSRGSLQRSLKWKRGEAAKVVNVAPKEDRVRSHVRSDKGLEADRKIDDRSSGSAREREDPARAANEASRAVRETGRGR